jgi:hypothetical protein
LSPGEQPLVQIAKEAKLIREEIRQLSREHIKVDVFDSADRATREDQLRRWFKNEDEKSIDEI